MLGINLRERIPTIKSTHAGNYLHGQPFPAEAMKTPLAVRTYLQKLLKPSDNDPITWPGFKEFYKYPAGVHTNWCSFYHELKIDGWKQRIQLPVFGGEELKIMGIRVVNPVNMITFVPNEGEVACFIINTTVKEINREFLEREAIFESELMKATVVEENEEKCCC